MSADNTNQVISARTPARPSAAGAREPHTGRERRNAGISRKRSLGPAAAANNRQTASRHHAPLLAARRHSTCGSGTCKKHLG